MCGSVKTLQKQYTHEWPLLYSRYRDFCMAVGWKRSVSRGMILQETCGRFYISFCAVKAEQMLKCNSLNLPRSADWTELSPRANQTSRYDAPKPVTRALLTFALSLSVGKGCYFKHCCHITRLLLEIFFDRACFWFGWRIDAAVESVGLDI